MKIKHKITLLFTLLVTAILLALSISIFYFTALDRKEAFYKRLKGRANNNAQLFGYFGDSSQKVLYRIDANAIPLLPHKSVRIYDTVGKLLYTYDTKAEEPLDLPPSFFTGIREERRFSIDNREGVALFYNESDIKFIIAVAALDEDGKGALSQLKKILTIP